MISSQENNEIADPILYRLYWTLMMNDIVSFLNTEDRFKLNIPCSQSVKDEIHKFHKRMLGFDTIAGKSQETVSRFLQGVEILWAEQGLFVRSSGRQPQGIENMDLSEIYKGKRVWDLL